MKRPGNDRPLLGQRALLDGMYAGDKAALRPLYDELAKVARRLGNDVDLTVGKTYVGIRRGKQFAMVKPWKSRVDLGLVLKGVTPVGRLGEAGPIGSEGMTHRIAIASKRDLDGELKDWLRRAYDAAV